MENKQGGKIKERDIGHSRKTHLFHFVRSLGGKGSDQGRNRLYEGVQQKNKDARGHQPAIHVELRLGTGRGTHLQRKGKCLLEWGLS